MVPHLSFSNITADLVFDIVRESLRNDADPEPIAGLTSGIDWSGSENQEMRTRLGDLEGWTADYIEGHMAKLDYARRLLEFLPETQRDARLELPGLGWIGLSGAIATLTPEELMDRFVSAPESDPVARLQSRPGIRFAQPEPVPA